MSSREPDIQKRDEGVRRVSRLTAAVACLATAATAGFGVLAASATTHSATTGAAGSTASATQATTTQAETTQAATTEQSTTDAVRRPGPHLRAAGRRLGRVVT